MKNRNNIAWKKESETFIVSGQNVVRGLRGALGAPDHISDHGVNSPPDDDCELTTSEGFCF